MSMKNLIAQMDAIEKGKKYIAESAAPVVEYKGGTDAEKIKNWQKHIDQFKEKGMYKAADDAEKSAKKAQPGFKPARSTDKPTKEGMGSIARALMQDMGLDEEGDYDLAMQQARGQMPGHPSYGQGTGNIIADVKAANQDRLAQRRAKQGQAATQAAADANPEVYGYSGSDAPAQAAPSVGDAAAMDTPQMAQQAATAAASVPEPAAPSVGDAAAMDTPQMAQQAAAVAAGAPQPTQPGTGDANVAQAMANKPAAQPGQPVNRDSMPFGKAFADARAKGETVFTWKGKQYAVKMASAGQGAMPAPAATQASVRSIDNATVGVNMSRPPRGQGFSKTKVNPRPAANPAQWDYDYGKTHNADGSPKALNPNPAAPAAAPQAKEAISEDDRILNMIRGVKF
jgi:hypothetical protein